MTEKELRRLKKTELLELLIALRRELDRMQAENTALREKLQTAEQNALHQVETDAVLAVRKLLQTMEAELAASRNRIQQEGAKTDGRTENGLSNDTTAHS